MTDKTLVERWREHGPENGKTMLQIAVSAGMPDDKRNKWCQALQYCSTMADAMCNELEALQARVDVLEAENARLREAQAMHGGRYWEARYRDEAADNTKLREIISRATDAYWGMRQTELSASEVGVELADKVANSGYGLHLKIAMKDAQALAGDDHG